MNSQATLVYNNPSDLVGASMEMDLPAEFKTSASWFLDKSCKRVNTDTIKRMNERFSMM